MKYLILLLPIFILSSCEYGTLTVKKGANSSGTEKVSQLWKSECFQDTSYNNYYRITYFKLYETYVSTHHYYFDSSDINCIGESLRDETWSDLVAFNNKMMLGSWNILITSWESFLPNSGNQIIYLQSNDMLFAINEEIGLNDIFILLDVKLSDVPDEVLVKFTKADHLPFLEASGDGGGDGGGDDGGEGGGDDGGEGEPQLPVS